MIQIQSRFYELQKLCFVFEIFIILKIIFNHVMKVAFLKCQIQNRINRDSLVVDSTRFCFN